MWPARLEQRDREESVEMPDHQDLRAQREIAVLRVRLVQLENAERRDRQAFRVRRDLSVVSALLARLVRLGRWAHRGLQVRRVKRALKARGDRLEPTALPDLPVPEARPVPPGQRGRRVP